MPKVANYFVRPEGATLSVSTLKDVQYGEGLIAIIVRVQSSTAKLGVNHRDNTCPIRKTTHAWHRYGCPQT